MTELALDHEQWDAFARHLHGMRVAQLMRREPTSHPRSAGRLMQLRSDAGRSPRTSAGRSAQDAEQRPDRERRAQREPRGELLPGPAVHPDLAPLAAFAKAHQNRAPDRVKVALG